MRGRVIAVAAAAASLVTFGATPAHADWIDDLDKPSSEAIARSVVAIEPRVVGIEPTVRDIKPLIRDGVEERTSGTQTVIDINTDLLFEFGSAEVKPEASTSVANLVRPIPNGATVQVYGHTDGIGTAEANLALSLDRANAVAAIIRGARGDLQLDVQGFGETQPLEAEGSGESDNPEARAKNRRVEVRYQG